MNQFIEFATNHPFLVALAAALAIAVLTYEMRLWRQSLTGVSPTQAVLLANSGAPMFDIRTEEAFAAGHIVGAKHFNHSNLETELPKLQKKFKNQPLMMCDERGPLAAALVQRLRRAGLPQCFHLHGGMAAWRQENLPVAATADSAQQTKASTGTTKKKSNAGAKTKKKTKNKKQAA